MNSVSFVEELSVLDLVNHAPLHDRHHNLYLLDFIQIDLKDVARKDHDIGELAWPNCAFLIFLKLVISGADRVSADCFFDGNLLFRNSAVRLLTIECSAGYRSI